MLGEDKIKKESAAGQESMLWTELSIMS